MRPRPRLSLCACGLAALALACSSEPLDSSNGSGGSASGGGSGPTCDGPAGYSTPAEQQLVGTVDAMVVDLEGAPRGDVMVQVCGLDVCISGTTMASGAASVGVGAEMTLPAFKYGDGLKYGKVALLLPAP